MENKAAYLPSVGASLEVKSATLHHPGPGQILVRNHAISINPIDIKMQETGILIANFPYILGMDISGTVEEVGDSVTQFKHGDRVSAIAPALATQNPAMAGFQAYTLTPENMASRIPDSFPFTSAAVLPLAFATACAGLFQPEFLGLEEVPHVSSTSQAERKDQAILIWGGSSAVGSCALQLCAANGLTVLSTSSKKNMEYVKTLGSTHVFDYSSDTIIHDLIAAAQGKTILGAYDAISSPSTTQSCAEFLCAIGGGRKIYCTTPTMPDAPPLPEGVTRIHGSPPAREQGNDDPVWMNVWREFMGKGLETGKLKAKPDALVITGGLEALQKGLDVYKKGVSAQKVVVEL